MDWFPRALKRALAAPLPGLAAQLRMAPRFRDVAEPRTERDGLRHAAALLLLYPHAGEWYVPLTLRGSNLRHHIQSNTVYTVTSDTLNDLPRLCYQCFMCHRCEDA